MKQVSVALFAVFLVTGYAAAAHQSGSHAGDSGTGAISDTPNAGKTAAPEDKGQPEDIGKPEKTGVMNALAKVPGSSAANNVLTTISNSDPGKSLGNAVSKIRNMFAFQNLEQAANETP